MGLVRARLMRARSDFAGAAVELRAARTSEPGQVLPDWLDAALAAAEAAVQVAQGIPAATLHALEQREGSAQPGNTAVTLPPAVSTLDGQVSAWLAQATDADASGRPTQARTALKRSLELAAPERLRRPFFEASPFVRERLLGGTELGMLHPWLERVPRVKDTAAIPPLTNKERETLEHLAHLLSTEEIADLMFVSINTVRTHIRNVLRKLGVSRRNKAIRLAWELELIPACVEHDHDIIDLRRTSVPHADK